MSSSERDDRARWLHHIALSVEPEKWLLRSHDVAITVGEGTAGLPIESQTPLPYRGSWTNLADRIVEASSCRSGERVE